MVDESAIRESLFEVEDPEMNISVIDLGLIYDVRIEGEHAEIDMTLTSPGSVSYTHLTLPTILRV